MCWVAENRGATPPYTKTMIKIKVFMVLIVEGVGLLKVCRPFEIIYTWGAGYPNLTYTSFFGLGMRLAGSSSNLHSIPGTDWVSIIELPSFGSRNILFLHAGNGCGHHSCGPSHISTRPSHPGDHAGGQETTPRHPVSSMTSKETMSPCIWTPAVCPFWSQGLGLGIPLSLGLPLHLLSKSARNCTMKLT